MTPSEGMSGQAGDLKPVADIRGVESTEEDARYLRGYGGSCKRAIAYRRLLWSKWTRWTTGDQRSPIGDGFGPQDHRGLESLRDARCALREVGSASPAVPVGHGSGLLRSNGPGPLWLIGLVF